VNKELDIYYSSSGGENDEGGEIDEEETNIGDSNLPDM
jgi:hypothetical protein